MTIVASRLLSLKHPSAGAAKVGESVRASDGRDQIVTTPVDSTRLLDLRAAKAGAAKVGEPGQR